MKVFISHSTKDMKIVRALVDILRRESVKVYVAYFDTQPGARLWKKIETNISKSDCVLAVLTKQGSRSEMVNQEIATANALKVVIIPILEKGVSPKGILVGKEYIELDRNKPSIAYEELAAYLKKTKFRTAGRQFKSKLSTGLTKWLEEELPFDDSEVRYTVQLSNDAGDAWIQRECTFVNNSNSPVLKREHNAFSTGVPMQRFRDLKLKAWDSEGNVLRTRKVMDEPTYKKFVIKFSKKILPFKSYSYTYRYFWSKLLPKRKEIFVNQDISSSPEFVIRITQQASRRLKKVLCKEIWSDGRNAFSKIIKRKIDPVNREALIKIRKTERFNKVEFLLIFEK